MREDYIIKKQSWATYNSCENCADGSHTIQQFGKTTREVYSIPIHAWNKHANKYHIYRDPGPDQPPIELFNWNSATEGQ